MQVYISYGEKPAWSDVEPVLQDDGDNPPVPIQYSAKFTDAMNYFRAVLRSEEKSQRVLDLTTDVIALNSANYTAWHYRALVCDAIGADWDEQSRWVTEMGPDNPKNYQIWNFRKQCVKRTKQPQRELDFIEEMLDDEGQGDAKNYHAWAYRQWLLTEYTGLDWSAELACVQKLLSIDVLNNSAWNHRFFCVCRAGGTGVVDEDVALREVGFAMDRIGRVSVQNDAAWAYALSWCRTLPKGCAATIGAGAMAAARDAVLGACEELEATHPDCLQLLGAMGELLEEESAAAAQQGDAELANAAMLAAAEKFGRLSELDSIRAAYWRARFPLSSSWSGLAPPDPC